nr:DUF2931 family protein [Dyella acidiphila]
MISSLSACDQSEPGLPYQAWRIGFLAPQNMEAWTEQAIVEDVHGHTFYNYESGTVAMVYNPDSASWSRDIGWGKGKYVVGAALPKSVYVRWQSLVERQTYSVTLEIPELARRQMLLQAPALIEAAGSTHNKEYYNAVAVGLAPGGIVRIWITGPGLTAIPMMCVHAQIESIGPSQGQTNGTYAYSRDQLNPVAQAYLKTHTIPYGIWGC